MINDLIFSLNKDKMTFFNSIIDKDLGVEELKIEVTRYIEKTHHNKSKIIENIMVKYDCVVDNFEAPNDPKNAIDKIVQEYFLVKHISLFLKKGHIPPTVK